MAERSEEDQDATRIGEKNKGRKEEMKRDRGGCGLGGREERGLQKRKEKRERFRICNE